MTQKSQPTQTISSLQSWFDQKESDLLKDFFTFLQFPSISTDPNYAPQVLECADWVKKYLMGLGFSVEVWETKRYPTLFASFMKAGPDKPTLLIYHHYDVQPVDPIAEWHSPPFNPVVRNGQVFARGAQDNKGQCFYTLQALKALLERDGTLPINIKICIEGEEECGSEGLAGLLKTHQRELKADYLAIVDGGIPAADRPAVTLGVRGLVTMEVEVHGSNTDLHSGQHGGVVFNPIHALVQLLASLRDASGKIAIPGFYDEVAECTDAERKQYSFKFDEKQYVTNFGANATGGEKAYSPIERLCIRPTLEINGITGGYTGSGFKTVIPAKASAKISCRLVPGQDPEKTRNLVADYLEKHAPNGVKVHVHRHTGGGPAVRASPFSKVAIAFAQAYSEVFQKPCEFVLEGASIPIIAELVKASGSEMVVLGLGLTSDQIHAPNEHFGVDRIKKGFLIMARVIELLGQTK